MGFMSESSPLAPHAAALLRLFILRGALKFGDFTLKSGRQSPYFINTGCLYQGADLALFGNAYAEGIQRAFGDGVQVVFGPAYKGIPLALAAAQSLSTMADRPIAWAYDRKEAKDHGDGGSLVGAPLTAGTQVVVVDDVLTAGTALRETIAKLLPLGVQLLGAVVAVDRQEAGVKQASARQEIEADFGLPVHPLMTISQAVDALESGSVAGVDPLDPSLLQRIRSHLSRP